MNGISHVIIDEAHERDLNTDFMLLLTKRAASKNPNLKIIIMSATINPELFQNYFSNSAALHIPGFTYPVEEHFLDVSIPLSCLQFITVTVNTYFSNHLLQFIKSFQSRFLELSFGK